MYIMFLSPRHWAYVLFVLYSYSLPFFPICHTCVLFVTQNFLCWAGKGLSLKAGQWEKGHTGPHENSKYSITFQLIYELFKIKAQLITEKHAETQILENLSCLDFMCCIMLAVHIDLVFVRSLSLSTDKFPAANYNAWSFSQMHNPGFSPQMYLFHFCYCSLGVSRH